MNNNRQHIEYHIKTMAEYQKGNGKDHKHKIAQQRPCKLINGCGDGCPRKAYCPQSYIGNDILKNIDDAEQNRTDVFQAFENGFHNTAFIVCKDKAHHKANYDKNKCNRSHRNAAKHQPKGENCGIYNKIKHHIKDAPKLQYRADISQNFDGFSVAGRNLDVRNGKLNKCQRKADDLQILRGGQAGFPLCPEGIPNFIGIHIGNNRYRQVLEPLGQLAGRKAEPGAGSCSPKDG